MVGRAPATGYATRCPASKGAWDANRHDSVGRLLASSVAARNGDDPSIAFKAERLRIDLVLSSPRLAAAEIVISSPRKATRLKLRSSGRGREPGESKHHARRD